jgi:phytoene synthase
MPEGRRRDPVLAQCRGAIRGGSRSFAQAARLFAPWTRDAAQLLYAWCRHCDDEIDGEVLGRPAGLPAHPEQKLALMREQTRRALAGEPMAQPEFLALQRVVDLHSIPQRYAHELLDGFAMDVERRRFHTLDDVLEYCYPVAGVVGLMMAHIMGSRHQAALRHAADLGLALQMTNIARDVVHDASIGRIYLPLDWLAEAGVPAVEIAEPRHRAALHGVVMRLLREADRYYASGDRGLAYLGFRSAWAVGTARHVYWEIGRLVERRRERAWDHRAIVPRGRQRIWVARALVRAIRCCTAREGWLRSAEPRDLWTRARAFD